MSSFEYSPVCRTKESICKELQDPAAFLLPIIIVTIEQRIKHRNVVYIEFRSLQEEARRKRVHEILRIEYTPQRMRQQQRGV